MALISTLLSLGTSGYSIISGIQAQQRAKKTMNELDEVDFEKSIADSIGPSIQQEMRAIDEIKRQSATALEAMQGSGSVANLSAGYGRIQQNVLGAINQQYDSMLNKQYDYDKLRLQNEQFAKTGEANKLESQVAGLAAESTAGAQSILSGIQGASLAVGNLESSIGTQKRTNDKITAFIADLASRGITDRVEIERLVRDKFGTGVII